MTWREAYREQGEGPNGATVWRVVWVPVEKDPELLEPPYPVVREHKVEATAVQATKDAIASYDTASVLSP